MAWCTNLQFRLLLLILLPCLMIVHGTEHGPEHLVLYAHESRVAPTSTIITSATPARADPKLGEGFGTIKTVSNVLRAGKSIDSTILGSQAGIVVVGLNGGDIYISFTYFLNANATYQGTIAVHGHIDGTSTVDRVFAVVGGTGDFLSVTGMDTSAFDPAMVPDPAHVINVHNLTLNYLK